MDDNKLRNPDDDFMKLWTSDEHGNECLRGLTHAETLEYRAVSERDPRMPDRRPREEIEVERDRYLALHDKHEVARLAHLVNGVPLAKT